MPVEIKSVTLPPNGVKEVEDGTTSRTVYSLDVRLVSGLRWVIERPFADFQDLHDCLTARNSAVQSVRFPRKPFFGGKTQRAIEQRRVDLEKYIEAILNIQPLMTTPIFNFLAVYAHLESYSRKMKRQQNEVHMNATSSLPAAPPVSSSGTGLEDARPVAHTSVESQNNVITKTAFRRDVLSVFPDMPSTFAIRFMKGFSDKTSNDITVDEFLRAVAILRHGSTEDQLLFSFNMCDHDHLGKLQSTGLSNLLVSLYGRPIIDKPEYKRLVNDLFDYGRTRLNADEFVHAMLAQPLDHVALVLDWMPSFLQILSDMQDGFEQEAILGIESTPKAAQKVIEMLQSALMAFIEQATSRRLLELQRQRDNSMTRAMVARAQRQVAEGNADAAVARAEQLRADAVAAQMNHLLHMRQLHELQAPSCPGELLSRTDVAWSTCHLSQPPYKQSASEPPMPTSPFSRSPP